ncbi:MAG TPA: ATP-grasp domain-containing protein, partial [Afifellaceae bacterium]|nr:ATP-grasp domain-containing protein [Afifellaceae bacterium]
GRVADTAGDAEAVARDIPAKKFAVKAQVLAGGRGKAGGVALVATSQAVRKAAKDMLGSVLVTDQTGPEGCVVRRVYVEAGVEIERSLFIAAMIDPRSGQVALVGSREGGEDIEDRAARDPGIIETLAVDQAAGPAAADFADLAGRLGLDEGRHEAASSFFEKLHGAFKELDASLIEINPLAITPDRQFVAVDAKIVLDDNALVRHPELAALRDTDDLDPMEMEAQRHDINFMRMDGDIGVAVNGAGLALATNDMLIDAGGRPANFMDIRTTATSTQIAHGFDMIFKTPGVKAVLINVHGGGMTPCDLIAEGLGMSMQRTGAKLPIVVRVAGNNADFARVVLKNCGIAYYDAADIGDAVDRVVAIAAGEAAA